jgi:hypothetical protein
MSKVKRERAGGRGQIGKRRRIKAAKREGRGRGKTRSD